MSACLSMPISASDDFDVTFRSAAKKKDITLRPWTLLCRLFVPAVFSIRECVLCMTLPISRERIQTNLARRANEKEALSSKLDVTPPRDSDDLLTRQKAKIHGQEYQRSEYDRGYRTATNS